MADQGEKRTKGSADGAAAVVNQLAIFLKAAFIYPREHRRVRINAEAFLEEIGHWLDPLTWVVLRIRGTDNITVADHRVETMSPHATWMQECFRGAVLAGLEFGPAIDEEALFELADCLRETMGNKAPEFSKLWPADHNKLIPLDLVFKGGHSKDGNQDGFGLGNELSEDGENEEGGNFNAAGASAHDVWKNEIIRSLRGDERIHSKLTSISECLQEESHGQGSFSEIDLLTEIVRLIPTDVRVDHEDLGGVLEQVLDSMQRNLLLAIRNEAPEFDGNFLRSALAVAQKFFENRPGEVVASTSAPTGWPADERIDDDVDQLVTEILSLPDASDLRMPSLKDLLAPEALGAELLGIYLYLVSKAERPETIEALQVCLGECLRKPDRAQQDVLHAYFRDLQDLDASTGIPPRHVVWPILSALDAVGLSHLVHDRDYLKPEHVAASFPAHFPLYAKSLDSGQEGITKLRRAVKAIDPASAEAGIEALKQEGGLEDPEVVDKILAVGGEAVLPLITVVAYVDKEWARTRVASYLRRLSLPTQESSALSCVEPPASLPSGYLVDLCRIAATKKRDWKVQHRSDELVRDFITRVEWNPDMDELRLHAIWALRLLKSPETFEFLTKLRNTGRFTRFGERARATRRAARNSLKILSKMNEARR